MKILWLHYDKQVGRPVYKAATLCSLFRKFTDESNAMEQNQLLRNASVKQNACSGIVWNMLCSNHVDYRITAVISHVSIRVIPAFHVSFNACCIMSPVSQTSYMQCYTGTIQTVGGITSLLNFVFYFQCKWIVHILINFCERYMDLQWNYWISSSLDPNLTCPNYAKSKKFICSKN